MKPSFAHLERYRVTTVPSLRTKRGDRCGTFLIPAKPGELVILADDGLNPETRTGWEHVSAHWRDAKGMQTPSWAMMCRIKELFWSDDECVVQYHPPRSTYVNEHPHVLHLWKQVQHAYPVPPMILV